MTLGQMVTKPQAQTEIKILDMMFQQQNSPWSWNSNAVSKNPPDVDERNVFVTSMSHSASGTEVSILNKCPNAHVNSISWNMLDNWGLQNKIKKEADKSTNKYRERIKKVRLKGFEKKN